MRWLSGMLEGDDSADSAREMWNAIEGMRDEGELTDAELKLIRGRLAAQLGDGSKGGLRSGKSAETARLGGSVRRNELQAEADESAEICLESNAESIQSAQPSKPTKIRGSDVNPGEVSEEP